MTGCRRSGTSSPSPTSTQLEFAGWDPIPDNVYEAARRAGVLEEKLLDQLRDRLEPIKPMPAVFSTKYVKKLDGPNVKKGANWMELADQLREDIRRFKAEKKLDRMVMVWCGSTEIYLEQKPVHQSVKAFEAGLKANDPDIAPSMVYAYAALKERVPFANGAPNLTVDIPAMLELAREMKVPICGKDFKTGQTMLKTVLAPMFKSRMLGVAGWYSTNILGNRDGEVLDDPESFKTKEVSKLGVLEHILQPDKNPDLYGNMYHKVRINYYPPRGDNKEGWDNIDIFGWLGYPMQIKVDFLCRDSILAAPLVLDLALFLDFAERAGHVRHPGVAVVLLQEPADRAGAVSRARPVHPAHETQEQPPPRHGRRIDYTPRPGVLRLGVVPISIVDPWKDTRWDAYVASHPRATVYHTGGWIRIVCEIGRYPSLCLVHEHEGRVTGVMPLVAVESMVTGRRISTLPFSDMCFPLADDAATATALLSRAREIRIERRARFHEMRGPARSA